jgi:saccharopine dehydrogenase (NAD+, L-lysine-forming)
VKIGIRREDKNIWERRAPLNPDHVRKLVAQGIEVLVQPSPIRTFPDQAYRQAGATISEDLSSCPMVFAIKEIPPHQFVAGHAYMYFAHVIKGQAHNMPMLQRLLDLRCTLIDYEKVTDEAGKRLIFFGRHAGLAGMIDSLWALGRRLKPRRPSGRSVARSPPRACRPRFRRWCSGSRATGTSRKAPRRSSTCCPTRT